MLSHNIPDCLLKSSCDGDPDPVTAIYSSALVFLALKSLSEVQLALVSPHVNNFLSCPLQIWRISCSICF